jgi:photosystem II stability/assembly factor-like uncharacterized protein
MRFVTPLHFVLLLLLAFMACKEDGPTNNTPNPDLPETPTLMLIDTSKTGNFIVRWTTSRRANSYTLQEDQDPTFSNPSTAYSGIDTTIRITGKPFGHAFYYRVKANNNEGSSAWSATKSIVVIQLPSPNILVTTATLDFGDTFVDSLRTLPLSIRNNGSAPLTVTNLVFSVPVFSLSETPPFVIPIDSTRIASIRFQPQANGLHSGTVVIESNDFDDYPPRINLIGRGITSARIAVNPPSLGFGDVLLDTTHTLLLTVSNTGNSTLVVSGMSVNDPSFSIIGNPTFSLPPGANHDVDIQFRPTARGNLNATLSIASNDSANNPKMVPLSGRGVTPIVAVSSDTLRFAFFVSAGMQETQLVVSNAGDVPLQVFNILLSNPNFTVSGASTFTLPPGGSQSVLVRLTSNQPGSELGNLAIQSNDRINPTFSVSLQGRVFSDVTVLAGTFGFQAGGVFRSTNSGGSWSFSGLTNLQVHCLVANNSGTVFAGTSNGVYRSTDNGVSWVEVSSGLTSPGVYGIAFNSSGHLYAATWGYVFRSTNNGDSWTATSFPSLNASSVAINSSDHIFVGVTSTNSGIFRSTDNGDTWTYLTSSGYVRSVAINSTGHIFAGTESGVLRSMNNGSNWSQVNSGLTNTDVTELIINSSDYLFVGTLQGVFRSTNNGSSWSSVNSGLPIAENTALAVHRSPDPAESHLFTAVLGAGVYRSLSNGQTWVLTSSGLTSTQISSLIVK